MPDQPVTLDMSKSVPLEQGSPAPTAVKLDLSKSQPLLGESPKQSPSFLSHMGTVLEDIALPGHAVIPENVYKGGEEGMAQTVAGAARIAGHPNPKLEEMGQVGPTFGERVGATLEPVAEFIAGDAALDRVAKFAGTIDRYPALLKVLEDYPKGGKILADLLGFGAKVAPTTAIGGAEGALKSAGTGGSPAEGAALGAISGGVVGAVSAANEARQKTPEEQATTGKKEMMGVLQPRVGRAGEAAAKMQADLDTAAPHLAKIERDEPTPQGWFQRISRRGDPEWLGHTAERIADYKSDLWNKAHEQPIQRHAQALFDNQAVFNRAVSEVGSQDDAVQSQKAIEWAQREIPRIETLEDADQRVRRLNNEIKTLPEEYGPVGVRVRMETLQALRDGIDTQLETLGEQGVRENNRAWGALRNIEDRLRERYYQETGKDAKASPVPDWLHLYAFAHPGGLAVGTGVILGRMIKPNAATSLASGMRTLAKSGLEPTPPTTPEYVGRRPVGLLEAGPIITATPEDVSSVRGIPAQTEAPEAIRRGRMLTAGEGVGPITAPPSSLTPVAGSEPTPTGGARGYTVEPQPNLRYGGVVQGVPAELAMPGYMRTERMLPPQGSIQVGASTTPQALVLVPPPPAGYIRFQASDGSIHDVPANHINNARQIDPNLRIIQK